MKKKKSTAPVSKQVDLSRKWTWILLSVVLIFFTIVRIRLLPTPLERDEGEYGYMAQLLLQGIPPYLTAYNMKMPGIYAVYALILLLFGQTASGIHFGLLLANLGSIILIFFLAKRIFDSFTGIIASASYAILVLSPSVLGGSTHATQFIVLFALGGLLLLLKSLDSGRIQTLFWSGLLFGMAFMMKQCGMFMVLFGFCYLAWSLLKERPIAWSNAVKKLALFSVSAASPFCLACLLLWRSGAFEKFWFWTVVFPEECGSLSLRHGLLAFKMQFLMTIGPNGGLWALAAIGLAIVIWNKEIRAKRILSISFLIASFLTTASSLYFRNHYYIAFLPALSLMAGVAISCSKDYIAKIGFSGSIQMIPVLLFLIAIGYPIVQQRDVFFQLPPDKVSRSIYGVNPFPEAIQIANYIKSHTTKNDSIAVLGSEAELYFYSQRKAATGYIYVYSLVKKQKYGRQMQQEMIREMEANRPKYIVVAGVATSWAMSRDCEQLLFEWMDGYMANNYEIVGLVDIMSLDCTAYYWDDNAHGRIPGSSDYLIVYRRK